MSLKHKKIGEGRGCAITPLAPQKKATGIDIYIVSIAGVVRDRKNTFLATESQRSNEHHYNTQFFY